MRKNFIDSVQKSKKREQDFQESNYVSTVYIDWLDSFSKKHSFFSTDDAFCGEKDLSENDRKHILCLEYFYNMIQEYANNNYIYSDDFPKKFYSIQHNNIGYHIGIDFGQDISFYCMRLPEPEKDSIPFDFIVGTTKLPDTFRIDEKLVELASYLNQLGEEVPWQAIENTTKEMVSNIKLLQIQKKR